MTSDPGTHDETSDPRPRQWTEPVLRQHRVEEVANNCGGGDDGLGGGAS